MGTHPNVILMVALTPDDLSRKTMRTILEESEKAALSDIVIGTESYHALIMEDSYDEGWQISAKEGDLVFFDLVTYGFGESITWDKLEKQKAELEEWAKDTCKAHNCTYEIRVTANYW
jgi:hypothetical protein